jgi:arylsulfatase I/J
VGSGFDIDDSGRRNYMDDGVGEIAAKLKAKGMWEDSIVVFLSDNGGPIYKPSSGTNHPLRGSKYSNFEGGIRTNALVTGGRVSGASCGTRHGGIVSITDCDLAGADADADADDANADTDAANEWLGPRGLPLLPPVDAVDGLWGGGRTPAAWREQRRRRGGGREQGREQAQA